MDNLEYIRFRLTERELLEQLAEEAAELSQAALKLIRAKGLSNNATPISEAAAEMNIKEEIADVLITLDALDLIGDGVFLWQQEKIKRWAGRLREAEGK